MRFSFGAWEPDSAGTDMRDQGSRVLMAIAENVYPSKTGYTFIPSLQVYSDFALPAKCVGTFTGHTSTGNHFLFAGTQTKLYKFDVSTGWIDYTRTVGGNYNVPADEQWVFAQFGSKVFATNINDNLQVIDIDTGATKFADCAGTPPKARYVGVVGDFLVLACLATNKRMIHNSALNDSTGWVPGVNLSDTQEFADGEDVTGFAGGEFGWVAQEHAIRRMIFQPGYDQAFRFERIEREHGCATMYGLVAVANTIFFPSDDGIYSFGNQLNPIGTQRVNEWFRSNSDNRRYFYIQAFSDFYAPRVYWAFYNNSSSLNYDMLLIYDWAQNQFSYSTETAQSWGRWVTPAVTLESLDVYGSIDPPPPTVPYSLDSRVWMGGQPVILAITPAGKVAFLNGSPLAARLLTSPMQLVPSRRSFVKGISPLGVYNDATLGMRVGKAPHMQTSMTFGAPLTPSTRTGIVRTRADGRQHQFELGITQSTGTLWAHAEGLDVDAMPTGEN